MKKHDTNSLLYRGICGALLGVSVIAPGISGSIIAVMMGIYDDLIDIISNPFHNFKKNILYLLPMVVGALLSAVALLQVLGLMFEHFRTPSYLLFIGLIAGSLPTVYRTALTGGFKIRRLIGMLLAFAFALSIGMMAKYEITFAAEETGPVYLSISGFIAGVTGMIPGMSVSVMLMTLNVYEPLLAAATRFDAALIFPVAVCFLFGMVLFSKVTKLVFRKYRALGYSMVLGFMSGSMLMIFPGLPSGWAGWGLSALALCAGLCLSFGLQRLGKRLGAGGVTENG